MDQDARTIMRRMRGIENIIVAGVLGLLALGLFMAACLLIFFLTGLFIVACQEYPLYVFPVQAVVWMVLSKFIHYKWAPL